MPAYQGGTVWLQVVPSFEGLQTSIRRGVSEAFQGAGIDKSANKAFEDVEKSAGRAGEASARRFTNSFDKEFSPRLKKMTKDFDVLRRSLPAGEFARIRTILKDISKFDLTTVTGQGKAARSVERLRGEFQKMISEADKGQRRMSDPARWNLGKIREEADKVGDSIAGWMAADPRAARKQAEIQKLGNLQVRAERERAAEEAKRDKAAGRALREQFALERNRDKLRANAAKIDSDNAAMQLRAARTLAQFTDRVEKGDRDAVALQIRAAKVLADFTARRQRDAERAQAAEQKLGQLQERAAREMEAAEQKRWAAQERAYKAMQSEMMKGVRELDRQQLDAHKAQITRLAAQQRMGSVQARAQRENVEIDIKVNRDRLNAEMAAIKAEIATLQTDVQIDADLDSAAALAKISTLRSRLDALERDGVEVDVKVDTLGAVLQLRRLEAQVNRTGRSGGSFMALLDAGAAANAVRVFNGVLFTTVTIGPLLIPVLAAISAGIFGVGAAALGAIFGVGALVAGLAGIGGAVGAMSELDRAKREDRSGAGAARDNAAARRQAIQDARSVADAQKQLSRARRDGAEAISDANRAVIDAEESLSRAHEEAADAASAAAERVVGARRELGRANDDAARAAEDAARRVRDAEDNLTDAQVNALEAQRDLNEARRQARRDLEDLQNQLDSARLNEQDLTFRVEEAAVHLNVVLEDEQATQRERDKAQLAYDQAKEALEQQQLETKRLTADTKEANKEGVEGSDRVKDAKERISDANDRVKDAEQAVADARLAQDRQAIDNAERLADAREAVTDAIENQGDVAEENARRIDDAEQALADARSSRDEARVAAAESVADAQLALARAHEDITLRSEQAATATDSLATAQDNLTESLRNLSPAGIAFATWLYGLAPLLRDIRFAAQEGLLPGLQEGLSAIVDEYGPAFVDFVGVMASVLGDLASEFGNMLANDPLWQDFFSTMADFGPVFLRQFGDVTINLLTAFASIMTAFSPFIAEMGEGLVGLTEDFAVWAEGLEGSSPLEGFFQYLRESGPVIGELLGNIWEILTNLFIGLSPYADELLDVFIQFTDWLAAMDPEDLANLALGIGAVVLAVQSLALVLGAISGVAGLIGGVVNLGSAVGGVAGGAAGKLGAKGAAAGAAPAAAAALGGVEGAAAGVGKKMIGVLGPIGLAISALWLIYDAALWLDEEFNIFGGHVEDFGDTVGGVFTWWWEEIVTPVWEGVEGVLDVMGQMFGTVGQIIDQIFRHIIGPAFDWLWDNTIGPWWDEHVGPMLKTFGNYVKENLPDAIRKGADLIADIWNGVLNIFRAPIRQAIDIVWNRGIIGSFNWLADKVPGMTKIDEINIPASLYPNGKKYATGGILPGYTPGRDVHRFVSPTGGVLDLSGGEPILRPEAGKVLGHDWVNGVNAAARGGGESGVQRFLGYEAHADGGFFGDILDKLKGFGTGFGKALTNPLGFFDGVVESSLSNWGVDGMFGDAIGSMVTSVPRSLADWIGDLIFGGSDAPRGGGAPAGAMGWQTMWNLVSSQFPGAALHSAFRPGAITAVGTPSYHGQGRAIDITPDMDIFNWLARTFDNATELIFSPAGGRQLWNGNPYLFGEPTRGDHWDHIHWAMAQGGIMPTLYDTGGDVPPGLSMVANMTGKPEVTLTNKFVEEMRARMADRNGPVVDARGSTFGAMPEEIVDEWNKQRRDNMALSGILDEPGVF